MRKILCICAAAAAAATAVALRAAEPIRFEGCQKYQPAELARSLALNLEYQLVSATAPPRELASVVERLLTAGYRHEGFPDAEVKAAADPQGGVVATIREGPRFLCGRLVVTGALHDVRSAALEEQLFPPTTNCDSRTAAVTNGNATNLAAPARLGAWQPERGAPFNDGAMRQIRGAVSNAFAHLGHFFPGFSVELERRPAAGRADLVVTVGNEGPALVIGDIEVRGAVTNTADEIRSFLRLAVGDRILRPLLEAEEARLIRTGRMIAAHFEARPPGPDGKATLVLRVTEAPGMPALREELTPPAAALLRLCDWIEGWKTNGPDLVVSGNLAAWSQTDLDLDLSLVLSPTRGFLAVLREPAARGGRLLYAAQGQANGEAGIYVAQSQRKFSTPRFPGEIEIKLALDASPPDEKGRWRGSTVGVGVSWKSGMPVRVRTSINPSALVASAYDSNTTVRSQDGIFSFAFDGGVVLRVAASGRPVDATSSNDLTGRITFESGALERAVALLRKESAAWGNCFDAARPVASFVSFAGPELLRLPGLATSALARVTSNQWALASDALHKLSSAAADVKWDQLVGGSSGGTNSMAIPPEASRLSPELSASPFSMLGAAVLSETFHLAPTGSWLAACLRGQAFRLCGQQRLLAAELTSLAQSPRSGPFALEYCASMASGLDPAFARRAANLGFARLTAADLTRDLDPLLDEKTMAGELILRVARAFAALSGEEAASLAALMPAGPSGPFQQFVTELRRSTSADFGGRLSAALASCWDGGLCAWQSQNLRRVRDRINETALGIPPPSPCMEMPAGIVDLGGVYNGGLRVVFGTTPQASNRVAQLATNVQSMAGHTFDVRGIVLTAPPGVARGVPSRIEGIAVGRACKQLHFLHGALNGGSLKANQNVADYVIRYEDGSRETLDVLSGRDLASSIVPADAGPAAQLLAAWEGEDPHDLPAEGRIRLYVQTWENPHPERMIKSVDMTCWHTSAMPFLAALTAD